ncbi:hypothetical protein [Cellulomonas hominis]
MHPAPFVSAAPRGEDVILARALDSVPEPRYLEVVADRTAPGRCSALAGRGWQGRTVTADEAAAHEAASVHALLVDGPDAAEVLGRLDLAALAPWVVIATAASDDAAPLALAERGFVPTYFDGHSRFYVAAEHTATLRDRLDRPAGPSDDYRTAEVDALLTQVAGLEQEVAELRAARDSALTELVRWRARAVEGWSEVAARAGRGLRDAGDGEFIDEVEAMRRTLSWRITKPLRAVRVLSRRNPFAR